MRSSGAVVVRASAPAVPPAKNILHGIKSFTRWYSRRHAPLCLQVSHAWGKHVHLQLSLCTDACRLHCVS